MSDLLALLVGHLWPWLAGAAAIVAALLMARRSGRQAEQARKAEEYRNTRERIDNAPAAPDADDARDWLRDRGKR